MEERGEIKSRALHSTLSVRLPCSSPFPPVSQHSITCVAISGERRGEIDWSQFQCIRLDFKECHDTRLVLLPEQ